MLGYAIALIAGAMILCFGVSFLIVLLGSVDVDPYAEIDEPLVWPDEARAASNHNKTEAA